MVFKKSTSRSRIYHYGKVEASLVDRVANKGRLLSSDRGLNLVQVSVTIYSACSADMTEISFLLV